VLRQYLPILSSRTFIRALVGTPSHPAQSGSSTFTPTSVPAAVDMLTGRGRPSLLRVGRTRMLRRRSMSPVYSPTSPSAPENQPDSGVFEIRYAPVSSGFNPVLPQQSPTSPTFAHEMFSPVYRPTSPVPRSPSFSLMSVPGSPMGPSAYSGLESTSYSPPSPMRMNSPVFAPTSPQCDPYSPGLVSPRFGATSPRYMRASLLISPKLLTRGESLPPRASSLVRSSVWRVGYAEAVDDDEWIGEDESL
jgi:hypothetical protein